MHYFKDKDDLKIKLPRSTYVHIRNKHKIADPARFIEDVLLHPITIVKSKWDPNCYIYYRNYRKRLYKGVVVHMPSKRIKTAHILDEIKGGGVVWLSPEIMN